MRKQVAMFLKIQAQTLLIILFTTLLSQSCVEKTPAVSLQATPILTKTITPKTTIAPSRTSNPTVTTTATPDYVATSDFIETASIKTILSTVQPAVLASYLSPDGKWRLEVIRYECINYPYQDYTGIIAYEELKLINLTDSSEQIVEDQLQNCDGIGGGGLNGLYWSPSNRYFYFTDWREGYPESCGNYIVPTVYRLDTLTKETIMVGGGHISPDKTKLAMWGWPNNEIVIWDLDKGEIVRLPALRPNLFNGKIWWSANSKGIFYIQTESDCAPNYGKIYIARLDLTDLSQSILAEYDSPSTEIAMTPMPSGTFALLFYPPLVMKYDTALWKDESQYADLRRMPVYFVTNYLRALNVESCIIGVQGPIGDFPSTPQKIHLGAVKFEVIGFTDLFGEISAYYIEDKSLSRYNYENGTSVLLIQANPSEWVECKALAENVLSTLRVP